MRAENDPCPANCLAAAWVLVAVTWCFHLMFATAAAAQPSGAVMLDPVRAQAPTAQRRSSCSSPNRVVPGSLCGHCGSRADLISAQNTAVASRAYAANTPDDVGVAEQH